MAIAKLVSYNYLLIPITLILYCFKLLWHISLTLMCYICLITSDSLCIFFPLTSHWLFLMFFWLLNLMFVKYLLSAVNIIEPTGLYSEFLTLIHFSLSNALLAKYLLSAVNTIEPPGLVTSVDVCPV